MGNALPTWERPHFRSTEGHAFLLYVVYGRLLEEINISQSKYRCAGVPAECELQKVERNAHGPLPFTDAEYGKVVQDTALFSQIGEATECGFIRCEIPEPPNLNYLRDIIGLTTYLLDNGSERIRRAKRTLRWARRYV